MRHLVYLFALTIISNLSFSQKTKREYYELKVYHYKDSIQEKILDNYFSQAYIPAIHKVGIRTVGVFKAIANDTAAEKVLYVLTPFKSLDEFTSTDKKLNSDKDYLQNGSAYLDAAYNKAPYTRTESILLYAFELAPKLTASGLQSPKSERLYELRSYESPTEKLYGNKVKMFNQGGEIDIFSRLGFNSVFYGEVIAGSHMPNLMYLTTYDNRKSRDEHWKAFSDDPSVKKLFAMEEYKNNVSKAEIIFLRPTVYSEL
ncbi:NIPSNAP family protein [Pinibacter aurantiacus]|uniref:NIPSNAP family protein n=1 Tax=Pinibacter aurantiacus TaxID=2851599 RepID=A0A9E2SCE9_9BACT|nr:NIPSNAP family protein [Pinibacter aurantiacus]MBV4360026.1 NIPSNAP family protein [Pinibacter aurantiacus]